MDELKEKVLHAMRQHGAPEQMVHAVEHEFVQYAADHPELVEDEDVAEDESGEPQARAPRRRKRR